MASASATSIQTSSGIARVLDPAHVSVAKANVSETFRDQLLRMKKVGFISDWGMWISLRDLRYRVVHDHLPAELADLNAAIIGESLPEFRRLEEAVDRPVGQACPARAPSAGR